MSAGTWPPTPGSGPACARCSPTRSSERPSSERPFWLKDLGEYERAAASLQEALEIAEENGNPMTAAHAMHNLANVYRMMGEPDRALALVSRSVQVRHSSRLPLESSFTLTTLAHLQLDQGLIEESLDTYRRAVEVGRRVGHADGLCQSLRFLGEVLAGLGRTEEGLPYLEEAAELFARLANGHAEGGVRAPIARIHEADGRTNAARDQWRRVHALSRAFGYGGVELDACLGLMRSAESDDDLTGARAALEDGIALARRLGEEEKEAELHNAAGIVAWRRDAVEEALAHYQQALSLFREREHASRVGLALNSLGVTLIRQGRAEQGRAARGSARAQPRGRRAAARGARTFRPRRPASRPRRTRRRRAVLSRVADHPAGSRRPGRRGMDGAAAGRGGPSRGRARGGGAPAGTGRPHRRADW
jgi:tetratricopeptide (TPR) repeat protein